MGDFKLRAVGVLATPISEVGGARKNPSKYS